MHVEGLVGKKEEEMSYKLGHSFIYPRAQFSSYLLSLPLNQVTEFPPI